jgi:hypothetical protein
MASDALHLRSAFGSIIYFSSFSMPLDIFQVPTHLPRSWIEQSTKTTTVNFQKLGDVVQETGGEGDRVTNRSTPIPLHIFLGLEFLAFVVLEWRSAEKDLKKRYPKGPDI